MPPPVPDYAARMDLIDELGARHPGYISAFGFSFRTHGLWGGIAIQTQWQQATLRDALPIWHRVNESLTVEPHGYSTSYAAGEPCPANDAVCQAWYDYFAEADFNGPAGFLHRLDPRWIGAQQKLWRAHNLAVERALSVHADEIESSLDDTPAEEADFWRGWVATVPWLEVSLQPTFDFVIQPISDRFFPDLGPLEAGTLNDPALLDDARRAFAEMMMLRGRIDTVVADYQLAPKRDDQKIWISGEPLQTLAGVSSESGGPLPKRVVEGPPWDQRPLEAQRRAALLSAFFHAYHESGEGLPRILRPIPLADAARILLEDDSAHGLSRRLRASAVLAEAGARGTRLEALEILTKGVGVFDISAIPSEPPENDAERAEREGDLYDVFHSTFFPPDLSPACQRTKPETVFDDPGDGSLGATFRLRVKRSLQEIGKALDPQMWPSCSALFEETSIVEADGQGGYVPAPDSPAPGSTYQNRLLYEHVVFDFELGWVGLRTVLGVSATGDTNRQIDYYLVESLTTEVSDATLPEGIEVDKGYIHAWPDEEAGWTQIEARKDLLFGGNAVTWLFNLWRKPMLRMLASEVHDMVCCPVVSPPGQPTLIED